MHFQQTSRENLPHCVSMTSQDSFMEKNFHHRNQHPQTPQPPIDCSSISYILRISYQTMVAISPGTPTKIMKIYNRLSISNVTLGIIVHEKFFHFPMYFSQTPTLFKGGGTNVSSRLKICKVSQDFWQVL